MDNIDQAIALCDDLVGKGLYSVKQLSKMLYNPRHFFDLITSEQLVVRTLLKQLPSTQDVQSATPPESPYS